MPSLFRKTSGWRWSPDSDAVNAPEGALLRAHNTIPDEHGSRSLRAGSVAIYTGLQEQRVHSLYTPTLQNTVWRLAGVDNQAYKNGVSFGTEFDGSGDMAFSDDSYQAFIARGKTKKKWDGTTLNNWGISAPNLKPTLVAVDAITANVAIFASTGEDDVPTTGVSSEFTINEGTSNFVANYASTASAALELIPATGTGRASCSKIFSADIDYQDIGGGVGTETDLFDMRVWLEEPRKVDKVTIMFGLNTGSDPFVDDYYEFTFQIKNDGKVDIKEEQSSAIAAYKASTNRLLLNLDPEEITNVQSPEAAGAIVKRLSSLVGGSSLARSDSAQNSPSWGHFTVTRGQFKRVGKTSGRDWKTVRGFKVVYVSTPGSTESFYLDDAIWTGGGARSLTGTFSVGYRFARDFMDENDNKIYTEMSPMSPLSAELTLSQQTLQITIPSSSLGSKDPQVTQVWFYLYGGWLDTFYRIAVTSAAPATGMTIDDVSGRRGGSTNFDTPSERTRLATMGFSVATSGAGAASDLVVSIVKSELDAMIENEVFEPGAGGPPNNIIDIAGPWGGRQFALTKEGWVYPSSAKRPSSFSLYHTVDLRQYGTPYWAAKTSSGIFVGCSKDIIRIAGSGAESANHITTDLYADPLGVANPPVDDTHAVDGNSIIYRSADGLMMFSGNSSSPVPTAGTSLLWKGYERYSVSPLNIEGGRFRLAIDNHDLYMLAPEAITKSSTVTITSREQTSPLRDEATVVQSGHQYSTGSRVRISGAEQTQYNGDFPAIVARAITSIARVTTTATVTTTLEHGLATDDVVVISGANQADYNGSQTITVTSTTTFTYTVDDTNSPTTPATGTITASPQNKFFYTMLLKPTVTTATGTINSINATDPVSLWKYQPDQSPPQWERYTYASITPLSIHREPDGSLLMGTTDGKVNEIEIGTTDRGADIPIEILTPIDEGGNPLSRKVAADFQLHGSTANTAGKVGFRKDGAEDNTTEVDFATSINKVFRSKLSDLGTFLKLQLLITGSFNTFSLQALGVSYRPLPQQVMFLDSGYIIPPDGTDLAWITDVEFDVQSPVDLTMKIYKDGGVLHDTATISVTANQRDVYRIQPIRGTKGRRLRFTFETTNSSGEGNIGFEPYGLRIRFKGSGNFTELGIGGGDQGSI